MREVIVQRVWEIVTFGLGILQDNDNAVWYDKFYSMGRGRIGP